MEMKYNAVFVGTSFLGIYNIGSAQCLIDHGKGVLKRVQSYAGTASGGIAASFMRSKPEKLIIFLDEVLKFVDELNGLPQGAITPGFDFIDRLRRILQRTIPDDAHTKCSGVLHLLVVELIPAGSSPDKDNYYAPSVEESVTPRSRPSKANLVGAGETFWEYGDIKSITEFDSKEELIEALLACSYVPYFEGWKAPQYRGKFWADGSLQSSTPIDCFEFPEGRLITISPNKSAMHQKPQDNITSNWKDISRERFDQTPYNMFRIGTALFPPKREQLKKYFEDGVEDAKTFLLRYRLYEANVESYRMGGPLY